MSNLNQTLPNTLHELIVLAVKDMKLTEKDKRYYINMLLWHGSTKSKQYILLCQVDTVRYMFDEKKLKKSECIVCMAGCVMAQTFGTPIDKESSPLLFNSIDRIKLRALDCIRDYNIHGAIYWFYGDKNSINSAGAHDFVYKKLADANREKVRYEVNKKKFYSNMLFIAKILKSQNI